MTAENNRRWCLIEQVGQLLYPTTWKSKIAKDLGISSTLMAFLARGERTVTDQTLNSLVRVCKLQRRDLIRRYRELILIEARVRMELGAECTEPEEGPGEQMREIEELEMKPQE
ncbi:hypothetical protein [Pelagibacterium mangrovi]|uniref:hypothetical protein n=1 Tax=Pelagibacterium mangrovi TaxID=3119828 RepID=UPI002FC75E69